MRTEQELDEQIDRLEKQYAQLQAEHDEYIRNGVLYLDSSMLMPLSRTAEKMAKLIERQNGTATQLNVLYWIKGKVTYIDYV